MTAPLTTLSGSGNIGTQFTGTFADAVYGTVNSGQGAGSGKGYSMPFNNTGTNAETANQAAVKRVTVTHGSPLTVDLSAAIKNICQQSTATFGHLIEITIALVTPIDDPVNGLNATSVTVTLPMSNALAWFFSSTDGTVTLTLKGGATTRGDKLGFTSSTANKQAISGSTASIILTNPDATNTTACVEITLVGTDT